MSKEGFGFLNDCLFSAQHKCLQLFVEQFEFRPSSG